MYPCGHFAGSVIGVFDNPLDSAFVVIARAPDCAHLERRARSDGWSCIETGRDFSSADVGTDFRRQSVEASQVAR